MANKTINDLTALSGVASGDYFPMWDISGAVTRKATLTNILAVLLAQENTFTNVQTIAPTGASDIGLTVNLPSGSTGNVLLGQLAAVNRFQVRTSDALAYFSLFGVDLGNNIAGPYLNIGRNSNATKPGSGFVAMANRGNTVYRIWPDNTGVLRIHTADPIYDNDVAGTVVGAQTSTVAAKNILSDVGDPREALQAIIDAAKNGLKRFTYKSGSFDNQEFEGIVTDYAPRYGVDRDKEHPQGKSLNEIQLFGDLIRAVAYLAEKIGLTEEK